MSADATLDVLSVELAVEAVMEILEDRPSPLVPVNGGTPLEALGFDSLDVAELFMALEERAGARLDPDSARDLAVVADLTRLREL